MATMGMADEIFPPTGDQTNKAAYCARTYKAFLKCSAKSDYAGQGEWKDADLECPAEYFDALEECRGTALDYDDADGPFPASLAIAGISSGTYKGYYVLPDESEKVYPLSCDVCSKFAKKLLTCGLPLQEGEDYNDALIRCGTTAQDAFLYSACLDAGGDDTMFYTSPADGPLEYGYITPVLELENSVSHCNTVQATATKNGEFHVQILKSSIQYPVSIP